MTLQIKRLKKTISTDQIKYNKLITSEYQRLRIIFEGIGLGIAIYKKDGSLEISDSNFKRLLASEIPNNIVDFFNKFGVDNELKTNYLLENREASTDLVINDKNIRLTYNKLSYDEFDIGVVIFARDITDEVEEENQRKKFVANVSHELKTPITVIKIYAETLLEWGLKEKKSAAVEKDIEKILSNSNRMMDLVNDLLLLSKIDSKSSYLNFREMDISEIAIRVVEDCQFQANEKSISLNLEILSKLPVAYIDKSSVEKILSNIILNAIKYTNNGGQVNIFISRVINDIVIKVKDNGIGISEKEQEHIFNRFYRVDKTGSREFGGTGLGLSIVKELIDIHHGKINVNSVLAYGSEFIVYLPMASKLYVQVLNDLNNTKDEELYLENKDNLIKSISKILVEKANSINIDVKKISDLTSIEKEKLLELYNIELRAKPQINYVENEDFAGVLSSENDQNINEIYNQNQINGGDEVHHINEDFSYLNNLIKRNSDTNVTIPDNELEHNNMAQDFEKTNKLSIEKNSAEESNNVNRKTDIIKEIFEDDKNSNVNELSATAINLDEKLDFEE